MVDKCAAGAVAGFCIEDLAGHLGKRRAMGFLNTGTVVSIEIYLIIPPSLSPEIMPYMGISYSGIWLGLEQQALNGNS